MTTGPDSRNCNMGLSSLVAMTVAITRYPLGVPLVKSLVSNWPRKKYVILPQRFDKG